MLAMISLVSRIVWDCSFSYVHYLGLAVSPHYRQVIHNTLIIVIVMVIVQTNQYNYYVHTYTCI
jgi:hypothetical protein